jgi:hypothetical protein
LSAAPVSATDISDKFVVSISSSITVMTVAYETGTSSGTISIIKNNTITPADYTTGAVFTTSSGGTTTTPISIHPISPASGDTIQVRSNVANFDRTCVILYFG